MFAAALAVSLMPAVASADVKLPTNNVPTPTARPAATIQPNAYLPETEVTASEALKALQKQMRTAFAQPDNTELKRGLKALSAGDIAGALAVRDALPASALDRQILTWAIASNGGDLSTSEIISAEKDLQGWPGMETLHRNVERSLHRENAAPADVIATLGDGQPKTMTGTIALARAHLAAGDKDAAHAALSPFWRTAKLDAKEEALILSEFDTLLTTADHLARTEQMLHYERVTAAVRSAKRAGAEQLAEAWAAVLRKEPNATKLLEAVPEAQRKAGYIFAKAKHLRWAGEFKQAAAVLLEAPTDASELVDPDAWWIERRVLSRELLDIGDPATAYKLAAAHAAESPALAVDAEFHAGWYALRGLRDAKLATNHFERIARIADGPISLARAHYWLGRAAEEHTPTEATAHYERAALHGTAFYGQLAAAKLGRVELDADYPTPTPDERQAFTARQPVQAIKRLEAAGYQQRADLLYRELAGHLASPGELALLAGMAEERGDHYLALKVGKIAALRGINIGSLAHPVGAIPASAQVSDVGKALAYAIARQESEFRAEAVSPVGARGLLQLLPSTARSMAKQAGMKFSAGRLTTDAGYNASLGAAYLQDQLGRFAGSYVLTFVGYNAGPGRAQEWIKRYGDPRGKDIDTVVDWIERIPFTETRTYVQRVMENYQVYKMRLTGQADIETDLIEGREG